MSGIGTASGSGRLVNAMTVDVEDYFHVSAFDGIVSRAAWDTFDSRVIRNTERVLELFDEAKVRATFFVLGWVAERYPPDQRRIAMPVTKWPRTATTISWSTC